MGVSQKWWGFPPKWMVKIMENPIKMDDFGGTTIFGNIYMGATPLLKWWVVPNKPMGFST